MEKLNNSDHTGIKLQSRTEIQAVSFNAIFVTTSHFAQVLHGILVTPPPTVTDPYNTFLRNKSETLNPLASVS